MREVNPDAMTSVFAVDRLERELLSRLIRGDYRAGEYLPSFDRLARTSAVSPATVRSAIGRLISRGFVTHVPGQGTRVEDLLDSCDLSLLMLIITEKSDAERALELEAQFLDMMSVVFIEVAYRAAGTRTEEQLKWYGHYLRVLLDRMDLDTHVAYLTDAQFQLLRVLAAAAGSVAFTVVMNSFRPYLMSCAALELFPIEAWSQLGDALQKKDLSRARAILQRCFDQRTAAVLDALARARGGGNGEGGPATVELVGWGTEP